MKNKIKSMVLGRVVFLDLAGQMMDETKKQSWEILVRGSTYRFPALERFKKTDNSPCWNVSSSSVIAGLLVSIYWFLLPSTHAFLLSPAQIQSRLALNTAKVVHNFQGDVIKGTAASSLVSYLDYLFQYKLVVMLWGRHSCHTAEKLMQPTAFANLSDMWESHDGSWFSNSKQVFRWPALANIWLQPYERLKQKCPIGPLLNFWLTEILKDNMIFIV